ncbi:hypothetical protein F4553_001192 [Allocatelliglobosispora scoriae]|uniref:Uncharacterized protein n=1 Tax=Allocatelliglobosispora scoriae TaxID=643052 RepID=A0A841BLF7_9ACTN|nr:hypothetical protein [Allocatelliglobosispora scoriae]MBB5867813.1 hypothetical protein [Allocatelliglobosispora scoriae]
MDYAYRCDLWAMAEAAIRGEIVRRRAPPPAWWPIREAGSRRSRRLVLAALAYLGLLVLLAVAAAAVGRSHV